MYDFIIKTSDERVLYFFEKEGICVKDLTLKSNKYKLIYDEGIKDFTVEDLGYGEVGIVCQNKEGSIIFIRENNSEYVKTVLLNNKSQVYYDKYFRLKLHGSWLGLSYIIEYDNKNILSFQIINNENEPPLAVDYIFGKNYFTFVNSSYDRIFFYNRDGEFGYKIYKWSQKSFIDYEKLSDGQLQAAISDFYDNFYIVFKKDEKFFLKTIKENDGAYEACDYPLDFIEVFDEINLFIEGKTLWIAVKRYNFTFGRKTSTEEISFSSQYNFFISGEIRNFPLSIRDKDKKADSCFGSISSFRPELILYKDLYNFSNSVKVRVSEEDREKSKEERMKIQLSKLEIRMSELEKTVNSVLKNAHNEQK